MLAVATAAAGALTMGGATAGVPGSPGLAAGSGATLSGSDIALALALRSAETTDRSEERVRLAEAAAAAQQLAAREAAAQPSAAQEVAAWKLAAQQADAAQADAARAAAAAAAAQEAARAAAAAAPVWVIPLTAYEVTSGFGPRWGKIHTGLDLAAPTGTPIRAMGDGVIVEAGWAGAYGQRTIIRHADGTVTWYCHQSRFAVTSGAVTAGQLIGYVGSTGNTTGPHLHLEVHPGGGDAIDPAPWIATLGLTL